MLGWWVWKALLSAFVLGALQGKGHSAYSLVAGGQPNFQMHPWMLGQSLLNVSHYEKILLDPRHAVVNCQRRFSQMAVV